VTPVIAINAFPTDHPSELRVIEELASALGVRAAVTTHVRDGGVGAIELAEAVADACEEPSSFRFLYDTDQPLREKIERISTTIYGAAEVEYSAAAARQLATYERNGYGSLPICMAKTHLSISSDPSLLGAPTGHTVHVNEVRASVGAGFVYPICGEMRTMPGLSASPAAERIDLLEDGEITGLS
jgi:formate--tetrahydrofolate ligase